MDTNSKDKEAGYFLMNNPTYPNDECLVYYYYNPDAKCWGYGFNIADGCGFLPEKDVVPGTVIVPVEIMPVISKKKEVV